MEFEHKSGIYMCTCNINGRSYIGQSQDVKLRRCHHLSELRSGRHFNQHLQRAYDKYKEYNFSGVRLHLLKIFYLIYKYLFP